MSVWCDWQLQQVFVVVECKTRLSCLQTLEQEEKDNEAVSKMMALDQKNQLLNLFHEKNRPTLAKWPQVDANHQSF